jgi:CheY-like chemotaxis protein
LLNLLNNARRFTEQGSITVQAVLENNHIKITVADTGKGIPADKLQTVFKEFEQLDDSVSLQHLEGSGLGLVISQRFVEMHGGRIWAESAGIPGQGSRFHFILPLKESTFIKPGREEVHRLPVRTPTGRGRSVLILDSDPAIKRMVEDALETYQVLSINDSSDIPDLLAETHPQAVVFNLMQPERAWQQLLVWKEKTDMLAMPMIFCPFIGPQQWRQARGVTEYLLKPITREALTTLLNRLDPHPRRILLVDDDPRMSHLLTRLLETEGPDYQISRANNGRVGLEMMQQHQPDLVLMDLSMPEMDGHTLLAQIQQDPALCRIPIAIITAYISTPEEERSLGGKSMFISHPTGFTNEEVLSYVRSLLDGASAMGDSHLAQYLGQGSQQVGLPDGFVQITGRAQ